MPDQFQKKFSIRSVLCFFLLIFCFLFAALRVGVLATGNLAEVQKKQSSFRISYARPRGTIFDCEMRPLTNQTKRIVAAVSPTPRAVTTIRRILAEDSQLPAVLSALSANKPTVCTLPEPVECDGISCTEIFDSSDHRLALHTIGYCNAENHGVCGLEAAFDELLYSDQTCDAVFYTDGRGNALKGLSAEFENSASVFGNGVVTTLNADIQSFAEQIAEQITCGAIVVCEAETGKLRALVSRPGFDLNRLSESLERKDSPFLNRCLSAFSVGSVFKPCIAAAALENGYDGGIWNCTGGMTIADRTFRCHNRSGHGLVDLSMALAFSCNTFFYQLALSVGEQNIYRVASSLNFGQKIRLCDGLESAAGNLPSENKLLNPAALANLSIGQGELLLSPIALTTLYCAIATDGSYRLPTLAEATLKDGVRTNMVLPHPTKVFSPETALQLRQHLVGVIANGTGIPAKPTLCNAGGKTATAQTGHFDQNGREITHGWFCGFFPAESPKYVAVIFSEDSAGSDTAPLFADLSDRITEWMLSKEEGLSVS
ncbi:MAG: penicillin-binding protein 2 [Clostridia bacterium]|nr:penicillin-binding protein 2 [Clostridia bacterium]